MAYLVLENGKIYEGDYFGAKKDINAPVVFYTTSSGYQKVLVDKGLQDQIVVFTYPIVGAYGINLSEMEGKNPEISALIVNQLCDQPSNWQSNETLRKYMEEHNVTGLCNVDTRALVKEIKKLGKVNARICSDLKSIIPDEFINKNIISDMISLPGNGKKIALIDLGADQFFIEKLNNMGNAVDIYPLNKFNEINPENYDMILISDAMDNIEYNTDIINWLKDIKGKTLIYGIGAGGHLLARSANYSIKELEYGHRGSNIAVKENKGNGNIAITKQTHKFYIDGIQESNKLYTNINDGTSEGAWLGDKLLYTEFYPVGDMSKLLDFILTI